MATETEFPVNPADAIARLGERVRLFEDRVAPDEAAHFRVLVPDGWREVRPAGDRPGPGGSSHVRRFEHRTVEGASVDIAIGRFDREIAPADWLRHTVLQGGHRVIASHEEIEPTGGATHLLTECDGAVIQRWWATKHADWMFIAVGRCAPDRYNELADELFVLVDSLAPLAQKRRLVGEDTEQVELRGLSFRAMMTRLDSWRPAPNPRAWRDEAAADALRLVTFEADKPLGWIDAELFEGAGIEAGDLVEGLSARLGGQGVRVEGAPVVPLGTGRDGLERWMCELRGEADGHALDCVALVLASPGSAAVLVSLRSPARDRYPLLWAVQRRAFDVACESIAIAALATNPRAEFLRR